MSEEKKKLDLKKLLKDAIPIIIFALIMGVLTIVFWPYIERLGTDDGREQFKAWIDELGFLGWLVTLGIQLLQIFVAFIPGEPVEIMMGYVWGPIGGMLTCLLGIFIGTTVIYLFVRMLGMRFVRRMVGAEDLSKYRFLQDKNKVDITVFLLFFIPGTPKDALSYIAPIAPIHPVKYILIATFARIPSIITSTLFGDRLAEGDYLLAIIVFAITAIISLVGIILGNKYVDRRRKKKEESEREEEKITSEK